MCFFFFFKQKTAYEMRISDWSSDVCSSDLNVRTVYQPLIGDHIDHLPRCLETGNVRRCGRDAARFMGRLDDDLGRLRLLCDQRSEADDGCGLCLILGETAHPLMEDGGELVMTVSGVAKIMMGELSQGAKSCDVLDDIAALALAQGDASHALLEGKEALGNGNHV